TDLPLDEITRLEGLRGAEINDAKIVLANETTTLAHGAEAATAAAETARRTFVEGTIGGDLPTLDLPRAELERGIPAFQLFTRSPPRAGGPRRGGRTPAAFRAGRPPWGPPPRPPPPPARTGGAPPPLSSFPRAGGPGPETAGPAA